MKIALAHDFLTQFGGAERVLEEFHSLFPDAPVFTLYHDRRACGSRYENWDIRSSFLQKIPKFFSFKWFLPLIPLAVKTLDLSQYDIILTDTSALMKGVKPKNGAVHICYCHTSTRYLWQEKKSYVESLPYNRLVKSAVKPVLNMLQKWDYKAAQKVTVFIANSLEVQKRIKRYYGRESIVVPPPVDSDFFTPAPEPAEKKYFLVSGRLEPYKRFDIAIKACKRLSAPLKVAGVGSQMDRLKSLADPDKTVFLGKVSDEELKELYRGARAFIFPALEDAGISVLESLACGAPVVCYGAGGAVEFVRRGVDGEYFNEQTVESLENVLARFDERKYEVSALVARARAYDKRVFKNRISELIKSYADRL